MYTCIRRGTYIRCEAILVLRHCHYLFHPPFLNRTLLSFKSGHVLFLFLFFFFFLQIRMSAQTRKQKNNRCGSWWKPSRLIWLYTAYKGIFWFALLKLLANFISNKVLPRACPAPSSTQTLNILEESNFNFRYVGLYDLDIPKGKWLNYLQNYLQTWRPWSDASFCGV